MNTSLPTIRSYGDYSSGNYGVNSLEVSFPSGFTLYYSYETIVAFRGRDGLKVRVNDWSTTTGKHLNWIDGGDKKSRLEGEEFEALLLTELVHHNLLDEPEETITVNYYSQNDFPALGEEIERDGRKYKVTSNDVLNQTTATLIKDEH